MTAVDTATPSPWRFLLHHAKPRLATHAAVFAGVLVAVLCGVGAQYGLKQLIDLIAAGPAAAPSAAVWHAFLVLCGFIAADNLLWRAAGYAATHGFTATAGQIREALFAHLLGHSPAFFADRLPGALAARVSTTAVSSFGIGNILAWGVLPPAAAGLGAIAITAHVHVGLAACLVGSALCIGWVMFRMARRTAPLHRLHAQRAAALDGDTVDVVGNIAMVRVFGATMRERRRIAAAVEDEISAHRRSLWSMEWLRLIHAVLTVLLVAATLAAGLWLWRQGRASVGDVALLATLSLTILNATRDLAVALVEFTQLSARLEEALRALLVPHGLRDRPGAVPLKPGAGGIHVQGVCFAYPDRMPVLRNLDLVVPSGQKLGIIGPSGSGKSTLLALLQRFHEPTGGRILIDGQDLAAVTLDSLHHALAVVPQDTALFHRSVIENIRYARPEASLEEIRRAARLAQCGAMIDELPDGLDTVVGNRGVKLSGGQRQRLAIARALLSPAPILLLDEATSALDSDSERAVRDGLAELVRDRTVIAVAHRLSTLQNFDRIIVLDQGRIVEDGTPAELASRCGPYRAMLRQQQGGLEPHLPEAA
ncbi:ABC transporter ATP-binding protein [Teichococcus vastitatis]|uniref:ABC transporter ATP-binding protein n=1 Tax=Teichococcus vastitatis TaxID=2307076 RepID=UPI000E72BE4B|nr:ABC transporter ATP-binding protein [Pseudoroseomonas vastitatis]